MYKPISIDRENCTMLGVKFPDLKTLDSVASAIGTNMFEGFEPTPRGIIIIRDYILGEITFSQLVQAAKEKKYV